MNDPCSSSSSFSPQVAQQRAATRRRVAQILDSSSLWGALPLEAAGAGWRAPPPPPLAPPPPPLASLPEPPALEPEEALVILERLLAEHRRQACEETRLAPVPPALLRRRSGSARAVAAGGRASRGALAQANVSPSQPHR